MLSQTTASEPGNELSKSRDDTSVKLDGLAKIMAAGAHANVKYAKSGGGSNENDGQSLMKKKKKSDSALCLGKGDISWGRGGRKGSVLLQRVGLIKSSLGVFFHIHG